MRIDMTFLLEMKGLQLLHLSNKLRNVDDSTANK